MASDWVSAAYRKGLDLAVGGSALNESVLLIALALALALAAAALALQRARLRTRETLAREQHARAVAERRAGRLARLNTVTAALSKAATPAEVGDVILGAGLEALGGRAGEFAVRDPDGRAWDVFRREPKVEQSLPTMSMDSAKATPAMEEAVRRGEPVTAFATKPDDGGVTRAVVLAIPLLSAGRAIGAIEVLLETPQEPTPEDAEFQRVLGRHCGEAFERARLFMESQRAHAELEGTTMRLRDSQHQLSFLHEASGLLGSSLDAHASLRRLAAAVVPRLADWCFVDLYDEAGTLTRLTAEPGASGQDDLAARLMSFQITSSGDTSGEELVADVTAGWLERRFPEPEHREALSALGPRSVLVSPLRARGRLLGVLTLLTAGSSRRLGPSDAALVRDLAGRAAMALDNARLYRAARDANAAKTKFLAAASHDLRSPANAIELLASLLEGDAKESALPAEAPLRRHIGDLRNASRSLATLLNGLLDLSLIESGQKPLQETFFSARELLSECLRPFQPVAEAKGLELHGRLTEPDLKLRADRAEIARVVTNLLGNAVKFTSSGHVALRAGLSGGAFLLEVEDTGPGLLPEHQAHAFDELFQADNPERDRRKGVGLGLAIARKAVECHGGQLGLVSTPGRGSTFWMRLPAERVASTDIRPARAAGSTTAGGPPHGASILIVDDDLLAAGALAELLAESGYGVRCAATLAEAAAAFHAEPSQVVLLDMRMPDGDGLDLVTELRSGEGPSTRVIAVTGDVTPDRIAAARAAGVDAFVAKPFRLADLLELLSRFRAQPPAPYSLSLL